MRFTIENMNCEGCAKGVTAAVRNADPAARVEVRLDRKEIAVSGGNSDPGTLADALQAAGWKAQAAA